MDITKDLPQNITKLIDQYKLTNETDFDHLVGNGGYIPQNQDVLIDLIVAIAQGKTSYSRDQLDQVKQSLLRPYQPSSTNHYLA